MRTTSQFYSFDDIMTIPDNIMAQLQLIFVEAICYCSKKDISVYYPPETLYVCCDNEELKIYKQSTLAFTLGMDAELKPTPRYIALFGEPSFDARRKLLGAIAMLLCAAMLLHAKRVKCTRDFNGAFTAINNPDLKLSARFYECSMKDFEIVENGSIFIVRCNNEEKNQYCIPCELFKMPNANKPRVFCAENTFDVKDMNVSDILSRHVPESCEIGSLTDAKKVYQKLDAFGFTKEHKVQIYSGWMWNRTIPQPIERSWVVIDDNSVLDLGINNMSITEQARVAAEEGDYIELTSELIDDDSLFSREHPAPLRLRCGAGKVQERLYIGVPTLENIDNGTIVS